MMRRSRRGSLATAVLGVVILAHASLWAQWVTFSNELTTGTTGWIREGTVRTNWVPASPPYLAYDNIQGRLEVGTYSRALGKRFEEKHNWSAVIQTFNLKYTGAAITYNHFYMGLVETNGWTSSDFVGVRISDNNTATNKRFYAYIQGGSVTNVGNAVVLTTAVDVRFELGYTASNKQVTVKVYRVSDNVLIGTSTATATGKVSLSMGNFGFCNGIGVAYAVNGFSINRLRDVSFSGYIPPPSGTVIVVR